MGHRQQDVEHTFSLAARVRPKSVIHTATSLQLIEVQNEFPHEGLPEFLDWDELRRGLPRLFARYWQPFTDDRRAMLEEIADWTLGPDLCDRLAVMLVEPVDRALRSDIAREWLLLCRLHLDCDIPVPSEQEVVSRAMHRIAAANPPGVLPNGFKLILSRANWLALEGALDQGMVDLVQPRDPEHRQMLDDRHVIIRSMVRGVIGCLLDDRLPRRSDFH